MARAEGEGMDVPTLDDFRWLVSEDASRHLARAARESESLVRLTQSLRQELSATRTHLVIELARLRQRAREKFRLAERMFFAARLLEQATEERIALYKGRRFPAGARVVDLCCGIGGDALGLAARGPVLAVDRSATATLLAAANGAVYEAADFQTQTLAVEDALGLVAGPWHIDPDRRPDGQRTTHLEYYEPSVQVLDRLRARQPDGCIKLSPVTVVPESWEFAEREWIGSRRECRQQVAWFGALALVPGRRRATVVDATGQATSLVGQADSEYAIAPAVMRYLFEPHAAVLAAQLGGVFARPHRLAWLAPGIAYLTGDTPLASPLASCFEVVAVLPYDMKQLRSALSTRHVGQLEIKARGLDVDPSQLRKQLRPKGDEALTLLLAGPPARAQAILARRVTAPATQNPTGPGSAWS